MKGIYFMFLYLTVPLAVDAGAVLYENPERMLEFTSCGSGGPDGPVQVLCDSAYHRKKINVTVLSRPPYKGVQVWTAPETNAYFITAIGARGGQGVKSSNPLFGKYVHARFNFIKGDQIYILVGQVGENACANRKKRICHVGISDHEDVQELKINPGGGGGGGGGTFVFKVNPLTMEPIILVVAGGGGGRAYKENHSQRPLMMDEPRDGGCGAMTRYGAGGGGGWRSCNISSVSSGRSLSEGGGGGSSCSAAKGWTTHGGFGGGGGACTSGGGGGGYTGGAASLTNGMTDDGVSGASYISPEGMDGVMREDILVHDGLVEIDVDPSCPCEIVCIEKNVTDINNTSGLFECQCPRNFTLAPDGVSCISDYSVPNIVPEQLESSVDVFQLKAGHIIGMVLAALCVVVAVVLAMVYVAFQRKKQQQQLRAMRMGMIRSQNIVGTVTEFNPSYDFVCMKSFNNELREVPRKNLRLVRPLGQGAFGEVYMGLLSNVPRERGDLSVAVKTLPALCTEQAEMDFFMEALIMSKFHHPNIVKFLGVCFDMHPRYIVLELLQGGDLKTFLRESRPTKDKASQLSVIDLIKLALDVAKGCRHLEENHFIHRDIAARNCLLTGKSSNRIAKIADFGMARDIYRGDYYRKGGKAMLPVKWMPPEAFLDGIFTTKTDVWSFSILLWEVFSMGYMPYPGLGNEEVMIYVTTGGRLDPPSNCPLPIHHIMVSCWNTAPDKRPTFSLIIEKLTQCAKDPGVLNTSQPSVYPPHSIETRTTPARHRDQGVGLSLRPHVLTTNNCDPSRNLLTVSATGTPSEKACTSIDGGKEISNSCEPLMSLSSISKTPADSSVNVYEVTEEDIFTNRSDHLSAPTADVESSSVLDELSIASFSSPSHSPLINAGECSSLTDEMDTNRVSSIGDMNHDTSHLIFSGGNIIRPRPKPQEASILSLDRLFAKPCNMRRKERLSSSFSNVSREFSIVSREWHQKSMSAISNRSKEQETQVDKTFTETSRAAIGENVCSFSRNFDLNTGAIADDINGCIDVEPDNHYATHPEEISMQEAATFLSETDKGSQICPGSKTHLKLDRIYPTEPINADPSVKTSKQSWC